MSQTTATATQPPMPKSIAPMQCLIRGRIEHTSRYEGRVTTRVVTPAPDPYSKPQFVAIRSKSRLGVAGDEISVVCALGGYVRKAFKATDKETGEIVYVTPVDMTLDLVE